MDEIKYKKSSWVIVKNESWKFLMLKKRDTWIWSFTWWKAEEGETHLECAIRELKEEAWIENVELDFFTYSTSLTKGTQWKECTYIANINNETIHRNNEPHLFSDMKFFSLDEMPNFKFIEWYDHDLIRMLRWEKEVNKSFEEII